MQTIIHADIFFFIASIGFSILTILLVIALVYIIRASKSIAAIAKKVEKDVDQIGDTAKEFILDLQNSTLFSLIFGMFGGKKRKKTISSK